MTNNSQDTIIIIIINIKDIINIINNHNINNINIDNIIIDSVIIASNIYIILMLILFHQ